jgi:ABC-type multidrug transport system ATPase subunit
VKITLTNIGKRYNRNWVFKNLNFCFEHNQSYAITGNNGSGKSTLLQILYNYLTYSEGTILFEHNGRILNDIDVAKNISFTAPYLELPEDLTLNELLKFHFNMVKLTPNFNPMKVLQSCGLDKHADKYIKAFSSGMKQRVKLILACYSNAPLLLLDEPTTNLDDVGIQWYRETVQQFLGKKTIIIASNQLVEYDFCNTVLSISAIVN